VNDKLHIRTAQISDAEELLAIYKPYIENTAITFEYDVPSIEEFANRIKTTLKKYPYIVAEYCSRTQRKNCRLCVCRSFQRQKSV
jgi:L-amino acid N-acyltransferase YncA